MKSVFYILTALALILSAYMPCPAVTKGTSPLADGWEYRTGDSPSDKSGIPIWTQNDNLTGWTPTKKILLDRGDFTYVWFRIKLEDKGWIDPAIYIPYLFETMDIYIGSKKIISVGEIFKSGGKHVGMEWTMLNLERPFDGKYIYARFYSKYHYIGISKKPQIGSRAELITGMVTNDLDRMIIGCLYILISIFGLFIFIRKFEFKEYFSFSIFVLATAVYTFFHTSTLQLFFHHPAFLIDAWLIALFIMPVAFAMFIDSIFKNKHHKLLKIMIIVLLIFEILLLFAGYCDIIHKLEIRTPFYLGVITSMLISLYIMYMEIRSGNPDAKILLCAFIFLCTAVIWDMIGAVFISDTSIRQRTITHIGIFIFIVGMAIVLIRRFGETHTNLKTANVKLAQYTNRLEEMVANRTEALTNACLNLETAKSEIDATNEFLTDANNSLEESHAAAARDMLMAVNVQESFFPSEPPVSSEWETSFILKPVTGVSGDFFDFYTIDERLAGVSIFDVSGHGISSGLITILAKSIAFRYFVKMKDLPLETVMERFADRLITELERVTNYLTGIMVRFNGNIVEYVNAGHCEILVRNHLTGEVKTAGGEDSSNTGGLLGKALFGNSFSSVSFEVNPGDMLLLYTDCLIESRNSEDHQYGLSNLIESFNSAPSSGTEEIMKSILENFYKYLGNVPVRDDLTIIIMQRR